MAQHIFSFLTTSLFMSLMILVILILSALLPKTFSPKLRYAAWVVILIGLIIPFRPMFGSGLITLNVPYTSVAGSGWQTNEAGGIASGPPTAAEAGQGVTAYGTAEPMWQTLSTMHVLVIAWAAVALAILSYHVWRYISFTKLINRWGVAVKDEQALSILQTVQNEKNITRKKIGLKKCDFVSTSMIVGFFNPTILLPDKNFDTDELELIFRHELIHYKRGDLFVKLLSVIAVSLNWFNPAVYFMSKAMHSDCEASCDEAVIADVGGENKQFYAEIVIDMIGSKRAGGTSFSTCFYGSKSGIKKRMEAIMNASGSVKKIAFSALAVLALVIVFAGSIFAFSSQPTQHPPQMQEPQYPAFEQPSDNQEQQSAASAPPQTQEPPPQQPQETPPAEEPPHQPPVTAPQSRNRGSRPSSPAISLDRAIEIAYADIAARGINATFRTDSGMSWERGQWVWELEFRTRGERMPVIEFYINVDNGNIVKFEWDD